jgi:6-phosphogluconate dehydrogenase
MKAYRLGIVGLGRMGGGLALQALEKGLEVAGFDVQGAPAELRRAGLVAVDRLTGFARALAPPRVILLYVPAGPIVDDVIEQLVASLDPGDVIADGGNSYWGDSIRRHQRLKARGLGFVDLGTSGGIEGARRGACFMANGDRADVEKIEPALLALAVPGGYVHAGPAGAGHFAKLVHNGIEFGMLQAIAEGVALLERYDEPLAIADVLACWRHGSVIRSWLVDLMEQAYRAGGLERIPPYVEDTGEVNWLVSDAMRMEVAVPVIAEAVMQLIASRDERESAPRAVAAMRHGFGGHPFGPEEHIRHERQVGRIGDTYRPPENRPRMRRR